MSFIELAETVPSSKKILLSLWFRVPAESIAAAKAEYDAWRSSGENRAPLTGIVPLVVFGGAREAKDVLAPQRDIEGAFPSLTRYAWNYNTCDGWTDWFTIPGGTPSAAHFAFADTVHAIDPSHIGVDCSGDVPKLSVNIVMPDSNKATINAWPVEKSSVCSTDTIGEYNAAPPTDDCDPGFPSHAEDDGSPCWQLGRLAYIMPFNDITYTTTTESGADVVMGARAEVFRTLPADTFGEVGFGELMSASSRLGGQEVTPEEWHNVILSLDVTSSCQTNGAASFSSGTEGSRTTSACQMHISFDDVNLTERNLSCYWPPGFDDGNAILPVNGFFVAGDANNSSVNGPTDDCWGNNVTRVVIGETPSYSYTPAAFDIGSVSLPAPAANVSRIKRVEMAEFQLFTDVSVDTSLENVRRAFVTEKIRPANLELAKELIGKSPEILLHRRKNWKKSRNTGNLGLPDFPEGTAVGEIKDFKPEPRLGR